MSTLLTAYYGNLRTALADEGTGGVYAWKDEVLGSALLSTVQMGCGPRGVEVSLDELSLDPEPATPDARGYLIFQAALLLMGGRIMASWKTRAMQVRIDPGERILTVDYLRRQILRLERQGDPHGDGGAACFGVWSDLENALTRATDEPERVV